MLRRLTLAIISTAALSACGISQEEHQKALDNQREALQAQMKKQQEECAKEKENLEETHEEVVQSKDQMIKGLESEVKKMGGNLASVRRELGDRVTQLASAKSELAATEAELKQLRKLREQAEKEAAQFKALAERFKSMIDAGQLEVVMRKGRINLKLPDDVLFPSGSKRLKKKGREALKAVVEGLQGIDNDLLIAGHTDNVPVGRGSRFKSNWELSTARAVSVVQLLIKEGMDPQRLAAAGFGEYDPIAPNDSKEGRAKNRRLEIILLPKLEKLNM